MLRHPVTFIVVMCGLALVAVYNFVFFTTRPSATTRPEPPPSASDAVAVAPTELNGLLDQLLALQKPRPNGKAFAPSGHEINAFLFPIERERGVPLNDVLEARAAARAQQDASAGDAPAPLAIAAPSELEAALQALELRAVIHGAESAVAVLGRTVVHEGDTLLNGAAVVIKIEVDRVLLQSAERTVVKVLKPFEPVGDEANQKDAAEPEGTGRAEMPRRPPKSEPRLDGKAGDGGTSVDQKGARSGKGASSQGSGGD